MGGVFGVECRSLSHVQVFVAPWTVAGQAPLSMEFFRQEHWSGLPCRAVLEGIFPTQESDPGSILGQEDTLEKGMATHSSVLA